MSVFRDYITEAMKPYQDEQIPEGDFTIGALVHAVMAIHDEEIARAFYKGHVLWLRNSYPQPDPEATVRSNIGWCFGEGMPSKDKAMWIRVCNASHPVFGQADITDEEAFRAGTTLAQREQP